MILTYNRSSWAFQTVAAEPLRTATESSGDEDVFPSAYNNGKFDS